MKPLHEARLGVSILRKAGEASRDPLSSLSRTWRKLERCDEEERCVGERDALRGKGFKYIL